MRRRVLTLCAATIAALSACANGYGGSVLGNSNQPTSIVFTNSSGSDVSFFEVAPNSATPLSVTATGTRGGSAIVQPQTTFTWSIRYGTPTDTYQLVNTATGLITYPSCPAVAAGTNLPASALVMSGATAATVGVLPSALASPAATAPAGSGTAASPVFCLVLTATASNNVSAPVTVLVSN
ncbi:MAG TPA: hypothetical protein VGG22_09065 [Candidatus Baltobacteraceae bacterium]|jgi:hypothetical protein